MAGRRDWYPPRQDSTESRRGAIRKVVETIQASGHFLSTRHGPLHRYNGRHWEELTHTMLQRLALVHGGKCAEDSKNRREIVELLRATVLIEDHEWGRLADFEVGIENGVLDLRTWTLRPHRPEDYLESVLPWPFDPRAEAPVWLKAVDTWLGLESAAAAALQEFLGYVCLSHAKYKKALLLTGPGDTGKSVVVYAARRLVGFKLTCRLSIEHMDDPRKCSILKGKRLNVITELSARALVADSGFKSIVSTEEPIGLDRKYHEAETYLSTVKCIVAANELPRIRGRTAEVFDRFSIVPMSRRIPPEEQDRNLQKKLDPEIPGIMRWAFDGARRLIDTGGAFTSVPEAADVLREWHADQNPMIEFVQENTVVDPGYRLPVARIAEEWAGRPPKAQEIRQVGRWLRDAGYPTADARPTEQGRSVVKCIRDRRFTHKDAAQLVNSDFEPD